MRNEIDFWKQSSQGFNWSNSEINGLSINNSNYHHPANFENFVKESKAKSIINSSRSELIRIVKDLNKIYLQKYGVGDAFSLIERTKIVKIRTNDWYWTDWKTWDNYFEDPVYREKEVVDYILVTSKSFECVTN